MDSKAFVEKVQKENDIDSFSRTQTLIGLVFYILSSRISRPEERDLISQMPGTLRGLWESSRRKDKDIVKLHEEDFIEYLANEGKLSPDEAKGFIHSVFRALKETISTGEAEAILAQLPRDLKEVWKNA